MSRRNKYEELKVLVVDDDKFMLNLVKTILQALGVRDIVDATDVATAFDTFKRCAPDLIITDWEMAPLDGLDLIRMIRKASDSPDSFVPIILLSAHMEAKRVMEARDTGVNEVLAKPISVSSLAKKIDSIVEHPRSYVLTESYFGPDRRRQRLGPPQDRPEKRQDELKQASQSGDPDEWAEIQALLEKE